MAVSSYKPLKRSCDAVQPYRFTIRRVAAQFAVNYYRFVRTNSAAQYLVDWIGDVQVAAVDGMTPVT